MQSPDSRSHSSGGRRRRARRRGVARAVARPDRGPGRLAPGHRQDRRGARGARRGEPRAAAPRRRSRRAGCRRPSRLRLPHAVGSFPGSRDSPCSACSRSSSSCSSRIAAGRVSMPRSASEPKRASRPRREDRRSRRARPLRRRGPSCRDRPARRRPRRGGRHERVSDTGDLLPPSPARVRRGRGLVQPDGPRARRARARGVASPRRERRGDRELLRLPERGRARSAARPLGADRRADDAPAARGQRDGRPRGAGVSRPRRRAATAVGSISDPGRSRFP